VSAKEFFLLAERLMQDVKQNKHFFGRTHADDVIR
jgi:hypothetical protein